jgi:hypothetical protein
MGEYIPMTDAQKKAYKIAMDKASRRISEKGLGTQSVQAENQGATPGILPEKDYVPKGGIHGKRPKRKYPKGEKAPDWRNVNVTVQEKHIDD